MPQIRKLSPAEVRAIEYRGVSQRKQIEAAYDDILGTFAPGDYGLVEPEPNEKRLTVRNRLRAAATRRGMSLRFLRTTGNALRFQVGAGAAAHNGDGSAPPKRERRAKATGAADGRPARASQRKRRA